MTCSEVALGELQQLAPPPPPIVVPDPAAAVAQILAAAQAQAVDLRAQAVRDGHAEGVRRGREEALAALAPAAAALSQAQADVIALREQAAPSAETRAVELAVAIAEKIVAGALAVAPERVVDVVRGALRGVLDGDRIIVCVNPDDVALVRAALDAGGALATVARIEVHEERRVARGGAKVRTVDGEIDATIAAKLERVRELAVEELEAG